MKEMLSLEPLLLYTVEPWRLELPSEIEITSNYQGFEF